jgi:hypothetical protein
MLVIKVAAVCSQQAAHHQQVGHHLLLVHGQRLGHGQHMGHNHFDSRLIAADVNPAMTSLLFKKLPSENSLYV